MLYLSGSNFPNVHTCTLSGRFISVKITIVNHQATTAGSEGCNAGAAIGKIVIESAIAHCEFGLRQDTTTPAAEVRIGRAGECMTTGDHKAIHNGPVIGLRAGFDLDQVTGIIHPVLCEVAGNTVPV